MNENYIELRNRSTFGDIINTYFSFLKQNFKSFTNLYLKYNAVSIVLTLLASYLLVTGFMGLASRDFRFGMGSDVQTEFYFIAGAIIMILILFITSMINYSFSSAYVGDYVKTEGEISSQNIWQSIKNRVGTIILFIIVGAMLYVINIIISLILAFIPFLGMIIQYGLSFTLAAVFGLTFMSIFSTQKTFSEAISEGFDFSFSNFWRVILFGLVIGILNLMITALILSVPSFIIGIYVYFSVESSIDLATSTFATMIFTFGFALFLLSFVFSQALSQVAYSILYYNLFEIKHNVFLREKIEQIGVND